MVLTVIIVNYNVKYLLEQCLLSVEKAIKDLDAEILIVDNHSSDSSLEYLTPRFPAHRFISNSANTGFSKANNQALHVAKGDNILFLNPDTLVPEDCFIKCLAFLQSHPDAGALGVKMINGKGIYLKESKRGFPSPLVSFYKMSGITSMFPRSRYFARYYMGHLDENETGEVDVLSGAFFWVKKKVLDKTGGFDEQFFMYAEDIDLSFRITQAGYKNYYYPGTIIIHYKGESTQKDFRYIKMFYTAMSQFAKKHYGRGVFSAFLDLAIWARAGIEMIIPRKNNTTR